jgi:hypothetical protein
MFERDGFPSRAGPTVITAILFEELFALFGEKFSRHHHPIVAASTLVPLSIAD